MGRLYFARYARTERLTHYLFRFPAKFHPAAVRCLVDRYSSEGQTILDPFCGSGTLLLEAQVAGRNAIGIDVDPVAAFVSRVKCTRIDPLELAQSFDALCARLVHLRRSTSEYDRLMKADIAPSTLRNLSRTLGVPEIPNIEHWFRRYVIVDLARLKLAIHDSAAAPKVRDFFLACFAGIIRASSNADPVPVSGLEVTAHMRRLDAAGRRIDPFTLFERRVAREAQGMIQLWDTPDQGETRVVRGDAACMSRVIAAKSADLCVTSPPYNTAVDYYRRHTLETYWLEFVETHDDRVALSRAYVGRVGVKSNNARLRTSFESEYINRLLRHAGSISAARERTVRHYCASMKATLRHVARALKDNGRAIFVVGNSKWNGRSVLATKVLRELAAEDFEVEETLSYPARNRYMSYSRHNGADVNREHVLVLRKER